MRRREFLPDYHRSGGAPGLLQEIVALERNRRFIIAIDTGQVGLRELLFADKS